MNWTRRKVNFHFINIYLVYDMIKFAKNGGGNEFWWVIDVLKEFASKKCGKLGKLLKESGNHGIQMKHRDFRAPNPSPVKVIKFHVNVKASNWFLFSSLDIRFKVFLPTFLQLTLLA